MFLSKEHALVVPNPILVGDRTSFDTIISY